MFDVYEEEPEVLTAGPDASAAEEHGGVPPEDVYGFGCPEGHVTAVLAGSKEPLPELLAGWNAQRWKQLCEHHDDAGGVAG